MRHPPARMTARRRSHRLAGPPPSVMDLLSSPLLPYPRVPERPASPCTLWSRALAVAAYRRRTGH